jgi:hydroxyacylglutathione hydrolase
LLLRLIYNDQLAQAAYLVGCQESGEALLIDPGREMQRYLALARREGLRVTAVTETHIHADFVSGVRELAAETVARLYLSGEGGPDWQYAYAAESGATLLQDGDSFTVGNVKIEARHTPGHTPEHLAFLLTDTRAAEQPMGVFTGDFVFVGDVGRPDLLETAAGLTGTMAESARTLWRSLQWFKTLPDYLQVWPGHGAGSACGKSLGAVPQSTVGYEKLFNWAFQIDDPETFVREVLEGQPEPPAYFARMKVVNKEGPVPIASLPEPAEQTAEELVAALGQGELVVDTRPIPAYAGGHLPGTLNIAYGRGWLTWAGSVLPFDRPVGLLIDAPLAEEAIQELRLIGYDQIVRFWTPDVVDWWVASGRPLQTLPTIGGPELAGLIEQRAVTVVDVRGKHEYESGHLPGAVNVPLGQLEGRHREIPAGQPVVVHCQTGVRSAIAGSLLQKLDVGDVYNYAGGVLEWERAGRAIVTETNDDDLPHSRG